MSSASNSSNKATRKNKLAPERKPYRVWFDNQAIIKKINKDAEASLKQKVDAFQQQKIQEINSMSEVDLKALLKPYRTPTTFKNRLKKGLQRTFGQRTSNNSKNELRALAHRLYIPGLVNKYRRDIEKPERAAAIARLNADEMREYQKELPGPKTAFSGDMGINFDAWRNATPEERSQGWAWKYPAAAAAGGRRFTVLR